MVHRESTQRLCDDRVLASSVNDRAGRWCGVGDAVAFGFDAFDTAQLGQVDQQLVAGDGEQKGTERTLATKAFASLVRAQKRALDQIVDGGAGLVAKKPIQPVKVALEQGLGRLGIALPPAGEQFLVRHDVMRLAAWAGQGLTACYRPVVSGGDRDGGIEAELGLRPPSTVPPQSVRAAILARVVEQTVGGGETPLLDGRYRLLREIGRGGAGTVWEAELLPLGRLVAVKLLRPGVGANGNAVSRLMREAMTVSRLGHEHIVRVNDVGTDEHGSPYIAMELLKGESLAHLVAGRRRLPWSDVAEIATQICDALAAAHAVGIVHRDVKPANVFATRRDDRRWRCKLLDFGLCTDGYGTPTALTAAGVLLGTPGYAAPEQIRGEVVDGRADLYGLACVMVELLTGRAAFPGETRQEIVANQLAGQRAGDLDALDIPQEAVVLIDRSLSGFAQERHDDPTQLAKAIASVQRTRHQPTRVSGPTRRAGVRRGYLWGVVTTLVCVSGLAIVPWASDAESVVSEPTVPVAPVVPQVRVEPAPVTPHALVTEASASPQPKVRQPPKPAAPPKVVPAKRVRRRAPKPEPRVEPEAPALPVRRAYPDGIRDPFASL